MTTKKDYTPEEWHLLLLAPTNIATFIVMTDLSLVGMIKEMRAFAKALKEPDPPRSDNELISAMVADLQEIMNTKGEKLKSPEKAKQGKAAREAARQALQQTAALLDEKCTPKEAAGVKQWLMNLARIVAEADKEGPFWRRGGERISGKEQAALAELDSIFSQ